MEKSDNFNLNSKKCPNAAHTLNVDIKSLLVDDEDSLVTHIHLLDSVPTFSGNFDRLSTILTLKTEYFKFLIQSNLIDTSSEVGNNEAALMKLFLDNYVLVNSTLKDQAVSTKFIGNRKFTIKSRKSNQKPPKRLRHSSIGMQLQKNIKNGTILEDHVTLDSIPSNVYCNMDFNDIPRLTVFVLSKHHFNNMKQTSADDEKNVQTSVQITDPTNLHDITTHVNSNLNKSSQECYMTLPAESSIKSEETSEDTSANESIMAPLNTKYSKVSNSDDLLNIVDVTPEIVKQKLVDRFSDFKIYTNFGPILIAINPFRYLPIYNPRYMQKYSNDSRLLVPHIFSVAAKVYEKILTTQTNQCVVINGISGSGKTESAKFLIQELLFMANSERETYIESITNAALQILEGFGNAITENNDNASRFGLVTQFNYSKFGQLEEAKFSHYLLEKSRITNQSVNDRNFHVFYYLESGLKVSRFENESLFEKDMVFNYLSNETKDQKYALNMHRTFKFKVLHRCFIALGLESVEHEIYKILLAILYTGNIKIKQNSKDFTVKLAKDPALIKVASLLKIDVNNLVQFLSFENITFKNEQMNVKLTPEQAIYTRDGLAKSLYVFVFDWLVRQINELLASPYVPIQANVRSILLLDIFGFENYKINSFEQFCINYANEAIQNYVMTSMLQKEQDMYISEGIAMEAVDYSDSLNVLQMIAGKPVSIIGIIVEESLLSVGSAAKMRQKINDQFKSHPKYIQTNNSITFSIAHYAGPVVYDLTDFRTKNLERNYSAIIKLICNSENKNIKTIILNFDAKKQWKKISCFTRAYFELTKFKYNHKETSENSGIVKKLTQMNSLRHGEATDDEQVAKNEYTNSCSSSRGSSKFTVLSSFQDSLNKLLAVVNECESSYIYCIRSNKIKEEFLLDESYFSIQLEYSGIFKGLNFLKKTFQNVFSLNDFIERFPLFFTSPSSPIKVITDLNSVFSFYEFEPKTYFVGKTKVFLMDAAIKKIVGINMNWYTKTIHLIELWWDSHNKSTKFKKIRASAILLQKMNGCLRTRNEWKSTFKTTSGGNKKMKNDIELAPNPVNVSKERLVSLLSPETITPRINEAFKQLRFTETQDDAYRPRTNTMMSNMELTSSESIKQSHSLNLDLNDLNDSCDNRLNLISAKLSSSKSCIIDVDKLEFESDSADDSKHTLSDKFKSDDIKGELENSATAVSPPKGDYNAVTINKSFRSILNYKKKAKSKVKSKHEKDKNIFSGQSTTGRKKKSIKSHKSEHSHNRDSLLSAFSSPSADKNRDIIATDHESFYIFIKYIQKYAFANQAGSSLNEPKDNLLSVFFTSLQRFTSVNHAIFVNAFRFAEPIHMIESEAVKSFEDILTKTISEQRSEFPVHIGTNSFSGLLKLYKNAPKSEITQLKKDFKRVKDSFDLTKSNITSEGHMMNCSNPLPGTNFCEVCNNLVWDDSYTCDNCHVVCHKRCIVKLSGLCSVNSGFTNNNKFFQVEISSLFSTKNSIPDKLVSMLQEVEKRCLNTEGIYRRQCNMEKLNHSRTIIDKQKCETIDFGQFEPLILSSLIKLFFRQLPSPLFSRIISLELTNAGDIISEFESLQRINQILSKVSKPNYFVLERLLAHLAAIAENEQVNKMTSYNLAIIFAPCLFDFDNTASIAQLKLLDNQRRVIQLLIDTLGKNLLRI